MEVVSWLVPIIIFGGLIFIIYGRNKEYIDRVILTLKNMIASNKKEKVKNPDDEWESILTYR